MGADNFLNNGFDSDSALYERRNRLNQPDYAPGQGMDDDLFSSSFEQPVGGGGFDIFSSPSQDIFGGMNSNNLAGQFNGDFSTGFNGLNQQQNEQKTDEDKFFEAITVGGKGLLSFFKDLVASSKGLTPKFISVYGKNVTITSLVVSIVGIILKLFGVNFGMQLLVGGLLSTATGVLILMFNVEKGAQHSSQYTDDDNAQNFNQPLTSTASDVNGFDTLSPAYDFGTNDFDASPSDFNDGFNYDGYNDEDEYNEYNNYEDDDFNFDSPIEDAQQDGENIDSVLESLPDLDRGMYTRQFLYDSFFKVLPNLKKDFSKVTTYDEESEVFLSWDSIIQKASAVTGLKDEDIPYLKELEENIFTIKATISRTPKMKPELIGDEVAKAYAYNTYSDDEERAKVFAKVETVLDDCIITVFTGASHMISLKDMYSKCEDFILDRKVAMPVVLGVNEKGNIIKVDFKKIESLIIAGMPRSGKSWFVQAILTQMCAMIPPSELNIYFLDPKASTSDFRNFKLPHVKKFASRYTDFNGIEVHKEYNSILGVLRWIVNEEAPRRQKLIGDHGKVNINDFKSAYPDVKLPFLYIVIDEMVTLSTMDKDDEKEYQSYLQKIVTQFPNLGIRGIFIPHEVKNQIINKTAYDSIKARISVKGSPEHIEASTGTKPRAFSYRLVNVGDMAVNIDVISASTLFTHGTVLTDDNDKNIALFDFLRRFWFKYEPEEFSNSVAKGVDIEKENNALLESLSNDDLQIDLFNEDEQSTDSFSTDEVFSNPNEVGLSGMEVSGDDDDFLSDFM